MRAAEDLELIGLVHPFGPSGGKSGQEQTWTLGFTLEVWRRVGGPIQDTELRIDLEGLSHDDLRSYMDKISPGMIVRLKLAAAPIEDGTRLRANLLEFIGPDETDEQLEQIASELSKPVEFVHPLFGTLIYDRAMEWYAGKFVRSSGSIDLYFSLDEEADLAEVITTGETIWRNLSGWERQATELASKLLLDSKNDSWLGDDEAELTSEEFQSRMKLTTISLSKDGGLEFGFDDGDLFWGHFIQVSGSLAGGLTDADIAG